MNHLRNISMENNEAVIDEEMVRITLEFPASLVARIDEAKDKMGFRSRSLIVEQLLVELFSDQKQTCQTEVA